MVHILIMFVCFGALVGYRYIDETPDPHIDKVLECLIEGEAEHLFDDEDGDEKKG